MPLHDRLLRSLFVGLGVGLAWGIRGDFGHALGASFPGAVLGLAFCWATGQKSMMRWMPIVGAIMAFGISLGGRTSYGVLHGYGKADTFINYLYGFSTLFMQGGVWAVFAGGAFGLLFEREDRRAKVWEWPAIAALVFACGFVFQFFVVNVLGFHINPWRSNMSIGWFGGALTLFTYFALTKRPFALKGAALGFIAFGLGMSIGRQMDNIAVHFPFYINTWNVMETGCGFIGGFLFTFGMLGRAFPAPKEGMGFRIASFVAGVGVFGIVTGHYYLRIVSRPKIADWTGALNSWGVENAETIAQLQYTATFWLGHIALLIGAAWMAVFLWRKTALGPLPALVLCFLMILFQDFHALYFYYPPMENAVNMHTVMWWMWAAMVLYACYTLYAPLAPHTAPDETTESLAWRRWVPAAAAAFAFAVFLAGFTNGEKTMQSANTRFPIWSWTEGPFVREKE